MKTKQICIHDANEFGTFDNVTGVCWVCGFTASELRARIQKQVRPNQFQRTMIAMEKAGAIRRDGKSTKEELKQSFPSLLQSAEDERRNELNVPSHEQVEDARINARLDAQAEYEDRDDGRSDGYGESYAERNV